ncbi:hypothetical protein JOM56_015139 [Amanita muscaria]
MSGLITRTLGNGHLTKFPETIANFSEEKPVGALVNHILEQWRSGVFIKSQKQFSSENYENQQDFMPQVGPNQKRKALKKSIIHRTTIYTDSIEAFTPEHWDRILNTARSYVNGVTGKKKEKTKATIPEGVLVIEDESCHRLKFVAKDDDY